MTKAESIVKNYKPTIRVGQWVRWGEPWYRREGLVIEDRGPLGYEGRQIIRVRFMEDYAGDGNLEAAETEIRAEEAEVIEAYSAQK
jgi:hypothetical protein